MEDKYVQKRINNELGQMMHIKTIEINERKIKDKLYAPDNFLTNTLSSFYQVEKNVGNDQQNDENK